MSLSGLCINYQFYFQIILSHWADTLKNISDGSIRKFFLTELLWPDMAASDLFQVVDQFEQLLVNVLRAPWTLLRTKDKEDIMKVAIVY